MRTHGTRWVTLQSIFALTTVLAVATAYAQQSVNVVAANSVNNKILGVKFAPPGGSTTVLNNDQGSLYSLQSLTFVAVNNPNALPTPLFSFDLLAADNQKGKILRYVGDFPTIPEAGIIVTTSIPNPTGLSADSAGNVFVLNDTPGHSPNSQVFVLKADGSGGLRNPLRIDGNSWGKQQGTVESLIVGHPLGVASNFAASPGDLVVLTSSPNTVVRYPGSGGNGPTSPVPSNMTTVLIGQCPNPQTNPPKTNCIPAVTASGSPAIPAGIAIWPDDGTLLISMQSGSILKFDFSTGVVGPAQTFATGPAGLNKIKIGFQGGLARAFVAQSGPGNHGTIIEFGAQAANGPIVPLATVTANVAAPLGIAATNTVQAQASSCQRSNGGCDLFGSNLLRHTVVPGLAGSGVLSGNVVEDVCVVSTDLRIAMNPNSGSCTGKTQLVNAVCPGFDSTNTIVIPDTLCGASGSNGQGYALIKTLTAQDQVNGAYHPFNGSYIENVANAGSVLPNPYADGTLGGNPGCGPDPIVSVLPIGTFAWAPLGGNDPGGEGTVLESPSMADVLSGCGSGHSGTGHVSLWGIGLALNLSATELQAPYSAQPLRNYAQMKYMDLTGTVTSMSPNNITNATLSQELFNSLNNTAPYNQTLPQGCIDQSWSLFYNAAHNDSDGSQQQTADFANAANLLANAAPAVLLPALPPSGDNTTCDSIVTSNLTNFAESTSPIVFNPSGQIRGRLANLYYTINTQILHNPAAGIWPPPISISVSPQGYIGNGSAMLSWALKGFDGNGGGLGNCAWSSNDPGFTSPPDPNTSGGPFTVQPTFNASIPIYTYTLSCLVTGGTMTPATNPITVTAYLTVQQSP